MKKIILDKEIFEKFPGFKRGIIVVSDIDNKIENEKIFEILKKEISNKSGHDYLDNDFIKSWDSVHLAFGSNPNKFPPSIKQLMKRIGKGNDLPFINSVVALFNYISIKYLIPCGGDDVNKIEGDLHLGFSVGNESFISLGSGEKESPELGEVIYFDDKTLNVMCRRWNWRNGDFTKITLDSKKVVINIDGVGEVSESIIIEARDELASLLEEQCGAKLTTDYLDINKKEVEIGF